MKRTKRMVLAQHDEKLRQPIALLKEGMLWYSELISQFQ